MSPRYKLGLIKISYYIFRESFFNNFKKESLIIPSILKESLIIPSIARGWTGVMGWPVTTWNTVATDDTVLAGKA